MNGAANNGYEADASWYQRSAAEAKHGFFTELDAHKSAAVNAVLTIARTLEHAADELRPDAPELAKVVENVRHRFARGAEDLRDKPLADLARQSIELAKRNPQFTLAAGLAAGYFITRLLRSHGSA